MNDESIHCQFACELYMLQTNVTQDVIQIIENAEVIEQEFILEALSNNVESFSKKQG